MSRANPTRLSSLNGKEKEVTKKIYVQTNSTMITIEYRGARKIDQDQSQIKLTYLQELLITLCNSSQ